MGIYHIENRLSLDRCLDIKFETEDKDPDWEEMVLDHLIGTFWRIHRVGDDWIGHTDSRT